MAGAGDDDDLFADLYDGEEDASVDPLIAEAAKPEPLAQPEPTQYTAPAQPAAPDILSTGHQSYDDDSARPFDPSTEQTQEELSYEEKRNRPVQLKDDGKMFIGGLNWETTDQSLKEYFSQFGEVTECTVMRDGATGRSRGFGFLTFRDPKVVNVVMVKEHILDGKLIDPKRAIPRDEQEKTSKIFVGGVSQDATEADFKGFFEQFGRVLDATLMMDKDTGRPRGFGFVTFDSDSAVDRTLDGPLEILGKPIEVKRVQPRNNVRDEEDGGGGGRGGRFGGRGGRGGGAQGGGFSHNAAQQSQAAPNNMSQAQMAQWWMNMQNLWKMTQQNAMQNNPAMMQQMMAMQAQNNPAMMQQMQAMYNNGGGMPQANSPMNSGMGRGNFNNANDQMVFEQQKYERQQMARMQQQNFQQGGTWDGMYDDEPAPQNGNRGGFSGRGRGGRGGGGGGSSGSGGGNSPVVQAPAGAPTGPKNAGRPGSNYRGGGRGGHRGFHPYARGGG